MMAVACSTRVWISRGRTPVRADTVAGCLPATAWHRQSAGIGARGPRYYDWAWIHRGSDSHSHLLIRRNRTPVNSPFYLCWSSTEVLLAELVRVAGIRWSAKECFRAAKGRAGAAGLLHWSDWRGHHQATARRSHHRRRSTDEPTG
ncbi:hypothetical protein AB0L74_19580 [Streptomyces sp. NPDC052020]|uniref:hypothetical protein n=1 Tax=Streptomyces sp. NPDC052020 TaxID=3155677 RepID=UPI003449F19C